MGYSTNYIGEINIPEKDIKPIKTLLKYMKQISEKCEWISSYSQGKDSHWYYEIDEWLGYFPDYKIECNTIKICSYSKHYCESVETLLTIISIISPEAEGRIEWDGEEPKDVGVLRIKKGKVYRGNKIYNYSPNTRVINNPKANIIERKYDFVNIVKRIDRNYIIEEIGKELFVNGI